MMRLLLLHGWLRGNLGDFCIASQLVTFLRQRFPRAHVTLLTEPHGEWRAPQDFLSRIDVLLQRSYRDPIDDLVEHADAVIQVPGGGLQDPADARAPFMLRDADTCHRMGVKHVFAGHSFHPSYDLSALRGSVVFAREPASYALLSTRGIPAILTADPAFLEEMPFAPSDRHGTALFLRRWHFENIEKNGKTLVLDDHSVPYEHEPLFLASSDPLRDDAVLDPLRKRHDLAYERAFDLPHLLQTINHAAHVISDRYHPIIFAAMMGVPYTFLQRQGSLRDVGLATHLHERSLSELRDLASSGFSSLEEILRHVPGGGPL